MNLYKNRLQILAIACAMLSGGMLTSCEDDVTEIAVPDMAPGEWYLEDVEFEEPDSKVKTLVSENVTDKSAEFVISPVGMGLSTAGDGMALASAKQLIIRSNSNWKIVPKLAEGENDDYVMMIPREGNGEMRVRVAVFPNEKLVPRTVDYALYVNGVEQENIFMHIEQQAAEAYMNVSAPNISSKGGLARVPVASNVDWNVEIDEVDWIEIDSIGETAFRLNVKPNMELDARSANIRVTAPEFPALDQEITINQLPDGIYLMERFDWLNCISGSAENCSVDLYKNPSQLHLCGSKGSGEKLIPDTQGWTLAGYNVWYTTTPGTYGMWFTATKNGFIKLSKTDFNGDVNTPVLSSIEGTKDIRIRFKAIAQLPPNPTNNAKYRDVLSVVVGAGSGRIDSPNQRIVLGDFLDAAGTLPGPNKTVDCMQFNVGFIEPSPKNNQQPQTDQVATAQTFEVIVKGADNNTRITFIGGAKTGHHIPGDKLLNCIYIDDVVIADVDREL